MNHASFLNLLFDIFLSFSVTIFDILGSELFWILIVVLTGIGRWLLIRETLHFAGKNEENLTPEQKKKKKQLQFWGKGLLYNGFFFLIIFILLLIFSKPH